MAYSVSIIIPVFNEEENLNLLHRGSSRGPCSRWHPGPRRQLRSWRPCPCRHGRGS